MMEKPLHPLIFGLAGPPELSGLAPHLKRVVLDVVEGREPSQADLCELLDVLAILTGKPPLDSWRDLVGDIVRQQSDPKGRRKVRDAERRRREAACMTRAKNVLTEILKAAAETRPAGTAEEIIAAEYFPDSKDALE